MGKRSKEMVARHSRKQRLIRQDRMALYEKYKDRLYPSDVPEATCDCCAHKSKQEDMVEEAFDEKGYPIIKKNMLGVVSSPETTLTVSVGLKQWGLPIAPSTNFEVPRKAFRFLDLPAELRTYVYELVFSVEQQPVCVNDGLLRPSDDLIYPEDILRECNAGYMCVPCQFHRTLGTTTIGLTRANRQLHSETALVPLKVNTFSVHNLYYLQAFLQLIGDTGRHSLKSLRFDWKLPEEELQALDLPLSLYHAYTLLLECKNLHTLWVDIDVSNLLKWHEDGTPRDYWLSDMSQSPAIAFMYQLRGLKDVKIRWKPEEGLELHEWAKWMIGFWSLPHGAEWSENVPVEAEMQWDEHTEWYSVQWLATEEDAMKALM